MALSDNNSLYVWGDNSQGQLGNGYSQAIQTDKKWSRNENNEIFVAKESKILITQIACGTAHNLVLFDNGKVWGWGG